jgi:Na+-translocating ferredoxin:NAD+ oxidoreductase RnfG subunit
MKRAGIAAAVFIGVLAALWGATLPAGAKEQNLKQLMAENFAGLQTILVALISSDYATVPAQVKVIEDHATQLTQKVPPQIAQADRDRFLSYAYNLRVNAADLGGIVQLLIEHDKGKQLLAADELRAAAAAHYGGMVTMCVACHNQFRRSAVR